MTEGPYKLPEGWRWVRLGEVVEHRRRSIDPRRCPDENFILYSIPAYDSGMQPENVKGAQIGSSKLVVEGGICLFSKLNPRIPRAWVVPEVHSAYRQIASTEFMPIKPKDDALDITYLRRLLLSESFLHQVRRDVTGATGSRQRLKPDIVLSALIPLPPLAEQRRIVARIQELMSRIREARLLRAEAQKDANRLIQAALAEVFPRPGTEPPPGWRWVRLGEVCESPQYGYTHAAVAEPVGPKFLRISDIQDGAVDWDKVPYCDCDLRILEKYKLTPDDILFARSGATTGKTFLVKSLPYEAIFASYLIRVKLETRNVTSEFVFWFLQSPWYWEQVKPRGAAQPNMNAAAIRRLFIPIPPLAEQQRIVAYLKGAQEKVQAIKEAQSATEAELHRLEQAILDRAFRGEL